METKDFGKVLLQYINTPDKVTAYVDYSTGIPVAKLKVVKGKRIGVVVSVGHGIMGWSLCNETKEIEGKKDVYNQKLAMKIALNRANHAAYLEEDDLEDYYENNLPYSIGDTFMRVYQRSLKYFQK